MVELPALVQPGPRTSPQRSWLARWWAPVLQLVVLAAVVVSGAGVIDARHGTAAADLAADRGAGPRVAVTRAALRHAAPVAVSIARLGVRSTLVDLRLNPNGTVQVPTDFAQAGWYVGSAHPGDAGPTVLIGHVDSKRGPGVFYRLPQLRTGDRISVARADRTTAEFVVTRVLRVPKKDFPTALVYRGDGRPSLRLVTCGGAFDQTTGHYLDNVIVLADPAPGAQRAQTPWS